MNVLTPSVVLVSSNHEAQVSGVNGDEIMLEDDLCDVADIVSGKPTASILIVPIHHDIRCRAAKRCSDVFEDITSPFRANVIFGGHVG